MCAVILAHAMLHNVDGKEVRIYVGCRHAHVAGPCMLYGVISTPQLALNTLYNVYVFCIDILPHNVEHHVIKYNKYMGRMRSSLTYIVVWKSEQFVVTYIQGLSKEG